MKIEKQFEVTTAAMMQSGDFFAFWRDAFPTFALAIEFDGRPSAVIFDRTDSRPAPWMSPGLPKDTLVRFPNAVVRSNLQDRFDPSDLCGPLIVTPEGQFMRAYASGGDSATINVATGEHWSGAIRDHYVAFSKWEVGVYRGETFVQVFSFDCAAPVTTSQRT